MMRLDLRLILPISPCLGSSYLYKECVASVASHACISVGVFLSLDSTGSLYQLHIYGVFLVPVVHQHTHSST